MQWFVTKNSIVREIWGKSDTILFIFAGSAAEFALNKAVDWLFFTGRLPADPIGRLFSTVSYARKIVFSKLDDAHAVIDKMADIHKVVEEKRGMAIPSWAYRDVLYMLIDYSIRAYELLERELSEDEKAEVYSVFRNVGVRMGIPDIPHTFDGWLSDRDKHLQNDLERTAFTMQLFQEYKKHLGLMRFKILVAAQSILVPKQVSLLLDLQPSLAMRLTVVIYKQATKLKLDRFIKTLLLPRQYIAQINQLDNK